MLPICHSRFNQGRHKSEIQILWKLIVDKKKEYLDSQFNTLQQNTEYKERQLKKLRMSARKQISQEVKDTAKPLVYNLVKKQQRCFDIKSVGFYQSLEFKNAILRESW